MSWNEAFASNGSSRAESTNSLTENLPLFMKVRIGVGIHGVMAESRLANVSLGLLTIALGHGTSRWTTYELADTLSESGELSENDENGEHDGLVTK